jgi:hypothetical protein
MKTSELTGAALDWAVAKADGKAPKIDRTSFQGAFINRIYLGLSYAYHSSGSIVGYKPSAEWAQGGPIIEREKVSVLDANGCWGARKTYWDNSRSSRDYFGPTPLIAAMRCYVASKLGDEVEIPEELTP